MSKRTLFGFLLLILGLGIGVGSILHYGPVISQNRGEKHALEIHKKTLINTQKKISELETMMKNKEDEEEQMQRALHRLRHLSSKVKTLSREEIERQKISLSSPVTFPLLKPLERDDFSSSFLRDASQMSDDDRFLLALYVQDHLSRIGQEIEMGINGDVDEKIGVFNYLAHNPSPAARASLLASGQNESDPLSFSKKFQDLREHSLQFAPIFDQGRIFFEDSKELGTSTQVTSSDRSQIQRISYLLSLYVDVMVPTPFMVQETFPSQGKQVEAKLFYDHRDLLICANLLHEGGSVNIYYDPAGDVLGVFQGETGEVLGLYNSPNVMSENPWLQQARALYQGKGELKKEPLQ